jgi:hypothetical protein
MAARGCGRISLALVTLLLATGVPAAAQEPFLGIVGLRGSLSVRGDGDLERIDGKDQPSRKLRNLIFDERLGAGMRGFFYDPALLFFDVAGEGGLVQELTDVDGDARSGNGHLIGYDARIGILRDQPYSLDLFAVRDNTTISRDFAGISRTRVESFGATGYLRELFIPLVVDVRQEEVDQRFTLAPFVARLDERRRIARLTGSREWERQSLDLAYEFNRREDLVNDAASFDLQQGDLRHRLLFGDDLQDVLLSTGRYYNTTGSFDARSILESETLRLVHGLGFSSQLSYLFADLQVRGATTRTHSGSATLTHQLYQSLTTNLGATGTRSSFDQGEVTSYGPFLDLAYRKRIPWNGVVSAGAGAAYQLQDQNLPGGMISVFQEQHVFNEPAPFFLDNPAVDETSISLSDAGATTIFDQGFDFFVTLIGNRIQIDRNPLGRILPGQSVLVSYDFRVPANLRYSDLTTHYDIALDYPWAGVFYVHSKVDSTLLAGQSAEGFIEDITDDRVGFEVRTPSERRLTFAARQEYERYRSERLSFNAFELSQLVSYPLAGDVNLSLSAGESFFDFSNPNRTTQIYFGRGLATWRPLPAVFVEGFAGLRALQDSLSTDTRFLEGGFRARVHVGQIEATLGYTHAARTVGRTDSMGDIFHFSVTRWFGR